MIYLDFSVIVQIKNINWFSLLPRNIFNDKNMIKKKFSYDYKNYQHNRVFWENYL